MSDDFSRDLSEIIGGHDQFNNTVKAFTQTQTAPGGNSMPPPLPYISPVVMPPQPLPPPPLPPTVQPMNTMGPTPGTFAYGQAAATHNYVSPAMASFYGGGAGGVPMNYPSPSMMTPHQYGVFRQEAVSDPRIGAAMSSIASPQAMPTPMLPVPFSYGATSSMGFDAFERMRGDLQFRRGFDGQLDLGSEYARVTQGRYDEFTQTAGKGLARMFGGTVGAVGGTAIGAGIGAFVGGAGGAATGARWGGNIGSIVGAAAEYIPGVDRVASAIFAPAIRRRVDALQTQFGSRSYLGSGRDLDYSGQGLSTTASQRMTHDFDSVARDHGMTRRDVSNIAQASGEQGLLDFSQNGEQIAKSVKGLVGLLATVSEITGDPDFMNNIKKMGQLQRLGFSQHEMGSAMRNMDSFARMAGLDIDQAMQRGGSQGAAIYQGAGQDAASGMNTGMFAQGASKLAVQSGVFDERTLALYGGKSGVTQLLTEANASFSAGPLQKMLPYLMKKDANGKLVLDKEALQRLTTGQVSFEDAIKQGSSKFHGDKDGLMQLTTNSKEFSSLVTRQAGPESIQQMLMIQGADIADKLGIDLTGGYMAMGLTNDQSRVMARMAESPKFFDSLRQQQIAERRRLGYDARGTRGKEDITYGFGDSIRDAFDISPLDNRQKRTSAALAAQEEDTRLQAIGAQKLRGGAPVYDTTYDFQGRVVGGRGKRGFFEELGDDYDRMKTTTSRGMGMDEAYGLSELVTDDGGTISEVFRTTVALGRDAVRGTRSNAAAQHNRLKNRRDLGVRTARLHEGARQLNGSDIEGSLQAATSAASSPNDKPEVTKKLQRDIGRAAAFLARKARTLADDDKAITEEHIRESLSEAGLTPRMIDGILSAPGGAEHVLNMARGLMDSKTRKEVDEKGAELSKGLANLAKEKHEQTGGAASSRAAVKKLSAYGFDGDSIDAMTDDAKSTLKEFASMSEDEIAGVMIAAMLNDEDLIGQSNAQKRAQQIIEQNPEMMKHVARGTEILQANKDIRKTVQGNLEKITGGEGGYNKVSAKTLRSRAGDINAAQHSAGITGLLKSLAGAATAKGVELTETSSPELAMKNINALSRASQAKLDQNVVNAARRGDRGAFLRAISASDGVETDGVVVGGDGAGNAETKAQDKKVEATAQLADRFAKYANANARALEENTRELKRFNDRAAGVPVPVEGGFR